jgi:hypothetical protein
MATEDNIISGFLYGELDYIYEKYGEKYHNETILNTLVNNRKVASASTNIKHYIIIGSECSICYEKIITNKTAYITNCGHCYHKKCIFKYSNQCVNKNINTNCPLCRNSIICDDLWLYEKYNSSHKQFNFLDKLENFNCDDKYNYDIYWCKYCKYFKLGKICLAHY